MPRLSIIVPLFNQLTTTQLSIASLLQETRTEGFQLVLIDDASTDGTALWIAELAMKLGSRLTARRNATNQGVNFSWNRGLELAKGDCVAVCNNDVLYTPGWDLPLMAALDCDAELGIVSPLSTTSKTLPKDWPEGKERGTNPVGSCPILGCCFMFRKSLLEQTGLVPEIMRHYYGDDWMAWAAKQSKLKCAYVRSSYVHHFPCCTTGLIPKWTEQLARDKTAYCGLTGESGLVRPR